MLTPRIHIVGIGVEVPAQLSATVCELLSNAAVVIGSERQLKSVNYLDLKRCELLPKLAKLKGFMHDLENEAQSIAVLASGDPLHYGIGSWFVRNFNREELCFHPNVSSIQAACHRVGKALQDVSVISLHGRPLQKLRTQLKANTSLVVLTDQYSHPQALAEECVSAGFNDSVITVCEKLGDADEAIRQYSVVELQTNIPLTVDPLHVSIVDVAGAGGVLPEFPGISDHHYQTGAEPGKGMISKREVRLAILSMLQPASDDVIWDIGAGCGGVAVELAFWNARTTVHAIEHNPERLQYLAANQQRFGVSHNLKIVDGTAPDCLGDLPPANKIFIGGSDGRLPELLQRLWLQLPAGGVLAASAVIDSTKQQLTYFAESITGGDVETVEVAVRRGAIDSDTQELAYLKRLPVEIFKFSKTEELS